MEFDLTFGYAHINQNRFVNDNLAPLGESWVMADCGAFFLNPEFGFSSNIAMADGTFFTPSAVLRYAALWLEGYTETGAGSPAANATVEDRVVGVIEARAGLDDTCNFDFGIERIYTDDLQLNEMMAVKDGDVVLVPRGHHPVAHPTGSKGTISTSWPGRRTNGALWLHQWLNGSCRKAREPKRSLSINQPNFDSGDQLLLRCGLPDDRRR